MHDVSGAPVRIVGIVMDVTRHRVETEALALERRRREVFVATLAHELRQPLSAILAAIEVTALAPSSDAIVKATNVMRRQVGQMTRVIDDLMDATRWAEGRMSVRRQLVDLRQVIGVAVLDVGAVMAERGHELVLQEQPEPIWVNGDPQRLQQVLSNLLRNAARYTDTGGRIAVDVETGPSTVALRISDNGIGIESDALACIFELFSQVHPSQVSGLGIGLSVVREIVGTTWRRHPGAQQGPWLRKRIRGHATARAVRSSRRHRLVVLRPGRCKRQIDRVLDLPQVVRLANDFNGLRITADQFFVESIFVRGGEHEPAADHGGGGPEACGKRSSSARYGGEMSMTTTRGSCSRR